MFKSCKYIRYNLNPNGFLFKLADSDFETELFFKSGSDNGIPSLQIYVGVVKEYEKRSLNTAANLALMYKQKMHESNCDINYLYMKDNKYYPKLAKEFYGKYLPDIKKYLLLI